MFCQRHRVIYWTAALIGAVVVSIMIIQRERTVAEVMASWGERQMVVISEQSVRAGQVIDPGAVRLAQAPTGLLPDGVLGSLPAGAVAVVDLVAGEMLVGQRVTDPAVGPTTAADVRGMALPRDPGTPPLSIGQRIDIVSIAEQAILAADVAVTDVDDERIVVAVPIGLVPAVAAALAVDDLIVVLR